jgi:hypothetical protein
MKNVIAINDRKCEVEGCNELGQHMGTYRKDGSPVRRKKCSKHHAIQYGLAGWHYRIFRKNYCENKDGRLGFECTSNIIDPNWQLDADHIDGTPNNLGEVTVTYNDGTVTKYESDFFKENILKKIVEENSYTEMTASNIQTLCKCCHAIKSRDSKDYETPGRKSLNCG